MFKLKPNTFISDFKYKDSISTATCNTSPNLQDRLLWHCVRLNELYNESIMLDQLEKKFESWPENISKIVSGLHAVDFPKVEKCDVKKFEFVEPNNLYPEELYKHLTKRKSKLICITSISPKHNAGDQQKKAVASWIRLGMKVYSLNCKKECEELTKIYPEVKFIETDQTGEDIFGKPYVRINAIIDFGMKQKCDSFMQINSDCLLDYKPELLHKLERESLNSFIYLIRWDYAQSFTDAKRQQWGIDGFIFNKKNAKVISKQKYCLGTPWFDQWLPTSMVNAGIEIKTISEPFMYHKLHTAQWSRECWVTNGHWIAEELKVNAKTYDELQSLCLKLRKETDTKTKLITMNIHDKIQFLLSEVKKPVIFELGANDGTDTIQLSMIPESIVHAFEADKSIFQLDLPDNVVFNKLAISSKSGEIEFIQSDKRGSSEWKYSGSIKQPKNHLNQYPDVEFKQKPIKVKCTSLDDYCKKNKIKSIDFIYADLQGAEEEFILGGLEILKKTRYIYTEYSDNETYENQINLAKILELLPDFRVMEKLKDTETNVLLKNVNYDK